MSAVDRIRRQLERLAHLRGLGPVASDHARWIDQTCYLLMSLFGEGSAEADGFLEAVGATPADRQEQAFTFSLPQEGPWGIRARLERGESVLRRVLDRLEAGK
ncbi:MAG: hypothetical protein AMJ77_04825 [Dehalococcoidia bacterium SM23_28_2]|nr:MAG: hypothetical protein AMJ77_04825 [Dehalococcoidia bacterium SM23_28_2]